MTSSVRHLIFEAIDSLMFRDGRPFNQADEGASRAVSVFPPHPPSLVGAARVALWSLIDPQRKTWNPSRLGDGTDWRRAGCLGPLAFSAPTVLRAGQPLYRIPFHVMEGKGAAGDTLVRLAPGKGRTCDLGSDVQLPSATSDVVGIKPIESRWVTSAGMAKIASGALPAKDDVIETDHLWAMETRVGIGIDATARSVTPGALYTATHVRMARDVSIGLAMTGWDTDGDAANGIETLDVLQPFGGEHRMASVSVSADGWSAPKRSLSPANNRYCVILTSSFVPEAALEPGGRLGDLPGTIVSACLGKAVPIGGWDSKARQPIPLRRAIPAGSVFFMKLEEGEAVPPDSPIGAGLGMGAAWGFGQYLIGSW
ncbi:type III-B CRISPR module-associated Cmr3 family protein [Rhizobium sp. SG2393]|uniref:type III-B CRISPR module-associated Cmr3 family protein n=1 Tax=Rhizobium sp. SG2393 TaxID=3276279 RepID=UPI003670BDD4